MGLISDYASVRTRFVLGVEVVSLLVSLVAITLICFFIWQRLNDTHVKHHSIASVTCILSYTAALLFVVGVTGLTHLRLKPTLSVCDAIVIVCIVLHAISKISEFIFLIERLYIISWTNVPRHRSFQYVIGCGLIVLPYTTFSGATIHFRFANNDSKICVIGIQFAAIVAIMAGEVCAELYLTLRFLWPLFTVHRSVEGLEQPLRQVIRRTFVASAITMVVNIIASTSIAMWQGTEPAYICCLSCKINVLVATCMLYWMSKPIQPESTEKERKLPLGVGFAGSALTLPYASSFVRPSRTARDVDLNEILAFYKYNPNVASSTNPVVPREMTEVDEISGRV